MKVVFIPINGMIYRSLEKISVAEQRNNEVNLTLVSDSLAFSISSFVIQ